MIPDAPYHPPVEHRCPYTDFSPEDFPADSEMKIKMVNGVFRVYKDEHHKEKYFNRIESSISDLFIGLAYILR